MSDAISEVEEEFGPEEDDIYTESSEAESADPRLGNGAKLNSGH